MIYTPVSKALKSANDNSRTRVAACSLRNAKRYLLFQARLLACVSSSHTHLPNQSGLVCQLDIKQWVPDHADFHVFFFLFRFVFFRKAKTLDDGKIQCTLKVDWGEYNGKGPNMKIAKATAAKLAIEGLKKKYAAVYEEE